MDKFINASNILTIIINTLHIIFLICINIHLRRQEKKMQNTINQLKR